MSFPDVPRSKSSFIPFLSTIYLRPGYPEPLPFDVKLDMDAAALTRCLGEPTKMRGYAPPRPVWQRSIVPTIGLILDVDLEDDAPMISLRIDAAQDLSGAAHHEPGVALFVAWPILRDLLDGSRFPAQAELITRIKARVAGGSELVRAALPRGLWDRHLVDRPGLRHFAYAWFHNVAGAYIVKDLITVFGQRTGGYGHDEPILDQASWDAVDKATPTLDRVFASWR